MKGNCEDILAILAIGIIGFCIGSFLNVLIYRLPRNLPFVGGRSFCPRCRKKISWSDNIPLLSFLFLKGRCRWCRKPISWSYPLVELLTGVLTISVISHQSSVISHQLSTIYLLFFIYSLVVIFFIDLEHQIIPDEIVFSLTLISFIFSSINNWHLTISNLLPAAVISAIFFYLLHLLTKGEGMGFGDVKLTFLLGLTLGFPKIIVCLYSAFLTGAIVGVILILLGKAKFGKKIAFGPFLVIGWLIAFFGGDKIIWFVEKFF